MRGNRIAAVGMAIAVIATLLDRGEGNWGLIVIGVAIGTAVGVPAARKVQMTAMPQMVALFNGVGGGAVFLIAWAEFRNTRRLPARHADLLRGLLGVRGDRRLDLLLGLEHRLRQAPGAAPRPPDHARATRSSSSTSCSPPPRSASASRSSPARTRSCSSSSCCVAAAILGNAVVLPIGGADMPVVISLLNAFTGLSAAATGVALNNPALIVAGMIVGASGSILTNLMAVAMNRSIPAIIAGGFGGTGAVAGATGAGEHAGSVRSTTAADVAVQLAYARQVVIVPGYGMAVAQAQHAVRELAKALEARGVEVKLRDPPGRRAHARPHERAARRGRRALRAAARRWTTSTPSSRAPTSRS